MKDALRAIGAQTVVEARMRLRSPATLIAVVFIGAGAVLWIPDPTGHATSLSWNAPDGTLLASVYSSRYLGWATTILGCIWAALVGFYLIAGSIRRDRERGVGAILAATPLSGAAYLSGKLVAHAAYLGLLSLLTLGAGGVAFLRWSVGAFRLGDFIVPWALFVVPAIVGTSAFAVFFDVTPGLRARAGLVIWFFAFPIFMTGPAIRSRDGRVNSLPRIDPFGMSTLERLVEESLPGATGFSSGFVVHDRPMSRVEWRGIAITPAVARQRLVSLFVALLPLGAAVLIFDRFDPARRRLHLRAKKLSRPPESLPLESFSTSSGPRSGALAPVDARPSPWKSVLAEARLTWGEASLAKWPLLAGAIVVAFLPREAVPVASAVLLLLLAIVISEAGARESLAGTRGLVFSQPGIPRSPILWKAAAVVLFSLALGAPALVRTVVSFPRNVVALSAGLTFTAVLAVSLASLTSGGKLFLALYTALWYASVNRIPAADYAGIFSPEPSPLPLLYLAVGAAVLAGAALRERRSA